MGAYVCEKDLINSSDVYSTGQYLEKRKQVGFQVSFCTPIWISGRGSYHF